MNSGGMRAVAAVMLMTIWRRPSMESEPRAGMMRIGTTMRNWTHAARHGMPRSLSSTSLSPKMPPGISEKKIFTGVAVHMRRDPRVAVSMTRPTTLLMSPLSRPK